MQSDETENKENEKKPDDEGQILVDEHIKIFDPNSGEVLVNKRET